MEILCRHSAELFLAARCKLKPGAQGRNLPGKLSSFWRGTGALLLPCLRSALVLVFAVASRERFSQLSGRVMCSAWLTRDGRAVFVCACVCIKPRFLRSDFGRGAVLMQGQCRLGIRRGAPRGDPKRHGCVAECMLCMDVEYGEGGWGSPSPGCQAAGGVQEASPRWCCRGPWLQPWLA